MIACRTTSATQTRELAAALAELARPGDVVLLVGELGAGKTVFAQGFGRGLGVADRITSPTFALHNRYEGRLRLEHMDVYRLGQIEEVDDLGLPELIDATQTREGGGVVLVEWGDTISPALPADYLEVVLVAGADTGPGGEAEEERSIRLDTVGPTWSARARALSDALAPWAEVAPDGEPGEVPPC